MKAIVKTTNGTKYIDDLLDIKKYTIPKFTQFVSILDDAIDDNNIYQWIIPDDTILEIEIIGDDY